MTSQPMHTITIRITPEDKKEIYDLHLKGVSQTKIVQAGIQVMQKIVSKKEQK